jgi:hypothetical protein
VPDGGTTDTPSRLCNWGRCEGSQRRRCAGRFDAGAQRTGVALGRYELVLQVAEIMLTLVTVIDALPALAPEALLDGDDVDGDEALGDAESAAPDMRPVSITW